MIGGGQSRGLWSAVDAAAATEGEASGAWSAMGVSIDSRTLTPGDLFAALRGPNHDGHDHVASAFANGAVAAMVDQAIADLPSGGGFLHVRDTYDGLCDLAEAARARTAAKICGITGSVGKTGTKELLAAALGEQGKTASTVGNLNNQIGLPLSLARMEQDCAFGVFEMGMNHANEITPLSKLARPHVAMITTIAPVHIENFDSIDGIAAAKAEIFDGLEPGGIAVLNRDNAFFEYLAATALQKGAGRVVGFGVDGAADARLIAYESDADGSTVEATIDGVNVRFRLAIRGKHWAFNALAVLAAAKALGANVPEAADALRNVAPPKGRGHVLRVQLPSGPLTIIDESYNASPIAMRAAFEVLAVTSTETAGRRIVALGDMLELGVSAPAAHAGLADDIVRHGFDGVFVCGQYMTELWDALPEALRCARAPTSSQLVEKIMPTVRGGDVVMVKGSAGSHMIKVVDALRGLGDTEELAVGA